MRQLENPSIPYRNDKNLLCAFGFTIKIQWQSKSVLRWLLKCKNKNKLTVLQADGAPWTLMCWSLPESWHKDALKKLKIKTSKLFYLTRRSVNLNLGWVPMHYHKTLLKSLDFITEKALQHLMQSSVFRNKARQNFPEGYLNTYMVNQSIKAFWCLDFCCPVRFCGDRIKNSFPCIMHCDHQRHKSKNKMEEVN